MVPPFERPSREPAREASSELDLWLDGLLDPERARAFEERAQATPELARELARARAIESALAARFAAPAESAGARPVPPQRARHAPPAPRTGARPRRVATLQLAAAALVLVSLAAALGYLAGANGDEEEAPRARGGAVFVHGGSAPCSLDEVFAEAAADDFEPRTSYDGGSEWDSQFLSKIASPGCPGAEELRVVGEYPHPQLDSDVVIVRAGYEAILLVVPREDPEGLCLDANSRLNLFTGCWNGRPVYELSDLDESRVLPCIQADSLARF